MVVKMEARGYRSMLADDNGRRRRGRDGAPTNTSHRGSTKLSMSFKHLRERCDERERGARELR
jgi:hypothetical protein